MLNLDEEIFKYNRGTWKRLVDKILKGKIILFIGAGLSRGSGLPDWAELIEKLCSKCKDVAFDSGEFSVRGAEYLQDCANKIEQELKGKLAQNIFDIIEDSQSCPDISLQQRLIKLIYSNGGVIVTTNYDRLLETAAAEIVVHRTHSYPYLRNQPLRSILDLNSEEHDVAIKKQLHIFKLHGDMGSNEVVLSKDSYNNAYVNDYTQGILNKLYEQDILFMGCSLSDPYFLSDWRGQQTQGEWFALYPTSHSQKVIQDALECKENQAKNPINEQISSLNINAIYYTIDDMKDSKKHNDRLSAFLLTLEKEKSMRASKKIRKVADLIEVENDNSVEALQFCAWKNNERYLDDLLDPKRFVKLKNRIKKIVFARDYQNEDILPSTFRDWINLKEVQLCSTIRRIGRKAFYGCTSLQKIYTSDNEPDDDSNHNRHHNRLENISTIGDSAFGQCKALEYINFFKCGGLTEIPTSAFEQCERLQKVTLPASLKELGARCFLNCMSLQVLNWVDFNKLESIGQQAFTNCNSLKQIIFPESLTKLGNAAFQDVKYAYLTGLDACKLTTIPEYAFKNCDQITSALFSDTVKTISQWAMAECDKLKTVIIPASVTQIGANAFTDCKRLEKVYFWGNAKIDVADNAFSQCSPEHQEEINQTVEKHRK